MRAAGLLLMTLAFAMPVAAQERIANPPAPPPAGIVAEPVSFSLGVGLASYGWDADAPFEDATLWSFAIDRRLGPLARGRALLGTGTTTLVGEERVDTRLYAIDLQVLVGPEIGPAAVYVIGGVGTVVTAPDEPSGVDLPTRSQSQVTFGGGARARFAPRLDAALEFTSAAFRLADPFDAEERETDTIHNSRWEGRLSWWF